ncbi:MAG: glycosyl transferase [Synechococcales cyanobacterium RM1_1_8]|nr:glycosyl transferase [Synechococcales cyanobacterium RM1_1_8]
MLTITLGTSPYPFNRPIQWLQALLENGLLDEPVFLQHGASDATAVMAHPLVTAVPIVTLPDIRERILKSRLVLSHAGDGSARMLAKSQVPFILLPRLSKYGEHVDNHQLYFAHSVKPAGVEFCLELQELLPWIDNPPPPCDRALFEGEQLGDYLLQKYAQPDPIETRQPWQPRRSWSVKGR